MSFRSNQYETFNYSTWWLNNPQTYLRSGCQGRLTQNLFYRIIRYRHTFDETAGTYKSLMYQMARNVHIDFCHQQRKYSDRFSGNGGSVAGNIGELADPLSGSEEAYEEDDFKRLDEALLQLQPGGRIFRQLSPERRRFEPEAHHHQRQYLFAKEIAGSQNTQYPFNLLYIQLLHFLNGAPPPNCTYNSKKLPIPLRIRDERRYTYLTRKNFKLIGYEKHIGFSKKDLVVLNIPIAYSIKVLSWNKNEVYIIATLDYDKTGRDRNDSENVARVKTKVYCEVYVPENIDFSVGSINANIIITGRTAGIRAIESAGISFSGNPNKTQSL